MSKGETTVQAPPADSAIRKKPHHIVKFPK